MSKITIRNIILVAAVLLAGVFSAAFYMVASVGLLIYLIRRLQRLPYALSFVVSVLLYSFVGSLLVHLAYIANISVDFHLLHSLLYLLTIILFWAIRSRVNTREISNIQWNQEEVFLLTLIIPFIFFTAPFFGASPAKTMQLIGTGEDTSLQFQMYNYVLSKGTVVYKDTGMQSMIRASLASYPQGSHAAAATITSGFVEPSEMSIGTKLASFEYSIAFVYSSIFVFALAIIFSIANKGKWQEKTTIQSSTLCVLSAATLMGLGALNLFINWVTYGFYGQIFAYSSLMFTVLSALIIIQKPKGSPSHKPDRHNSDNLIFWVTVMSIGFFGVYGSWYLLAPIALLPVIAVIILRFRNLLRYYREIISASLLPLIVCVFLTYVYLFTGDSSNHILTPGGVVQVAWMFPAIVSMPVLGILVYSLKYKLWDQALISGMALAASIFAGLVGIYQQIKLDHLDYYFYKTTFTALLLILISCIAFVVFILQNTKVVQRYRVQLLVNISVASLLVFGVICARYTKDDFWYYYSTQYGVVQLENRMNHDILADPTIYNKYSDMIFVGDCNKYQNFLGTIWSGSMFLQYGQTRGSIEGAVLQKEGEGMVEIVSEYSKKRDKPVAVHISGDCSSQYDAARAENVEFLRK